MKNSITETGSTSSGETGEDGFSRKTYERPVLHYYGALKEMTKGPGSGDNEAGGSTTGNMRPTGSSDRALKEDVVRIGSHPLGIGLYLFNFKPEFQNTCGQQRQFGVMADEVEKVMPAAVTTDRDGYKLVNYDMLGIHRNVH